MSNHDVSRVMSRWCGGDERKLRSALLSLLTLRGTPVLYYGDEIGMPDTPIGEQELQDPLGKRYWPLPRGRDPERTPMLWTDAIGAGFTDPQVRPWLPIGNARIRNVADQRHDSSSILCFVRDVIALRRTSSDLQGGAYRQLRSPDGVWAWQRGQGTTVVLNLSDRRIRLPQTTGTILIATAREREAQRVDGGLELGPWEGAVCSSGST